MPRSSPVVSNPTLPIPTGLTGLYESPRLLIPIDYSNPDIAIGNQFIAQISTTYSTLVTFDIPLSYSRKSCNLAFYLPLESHEWWKPFTMRASGGIAVSQLMIPASQDTTARTVGAVRPIGSVGLLAQGRGHLISSGPCEAGKTVGYQVSAVGGLDLHYFQLVKPALGLFVTING